MGKHQGEQIKNLDRTPTESQLAQGERGKKEIKLIKIRKEKE